MLLYSTQAYTVFTTRLQAALTAMDKHCVVGGIERRSFPDGEHYHRLLDNPAGQHTLLVGGTTTDADTLELYDLACALVAAGASRLTLCIPYYGYSTMERAVRPGEVVKARTRALLLSAIPPASQGNQVLLLDLHSEGIPHYFGAQLTAQHVYGKAVVLAAARALGGSDFVLAATDSGRAKWVESLAAELQVPPAFVYKRRHTGSSTQVTGVNADVRGRRVIIYDDMVRTGGSLLAAAQVYHDHGATEVHAIATHLVLPGNSLQKIKGSGLLASLTGTDSHPAALAITDPFVQVHSVAPAVAQALLLPAHW